MRTNKADIAVFFEGIYTPAAAVTIDVVAGKPKMAVIDIPYIGQCEELMLTTHTAVFFRFLEPHSTPTWPFPASALDEYKLAFHGEVTRVSVSRNGLNMVYRIEVTDSSSYLNRMPSQFTWSLIGQNYRDNKDDYEFLGLPFTGDDYATHWFTEQTRLMNAYAPRQSYYGPANTEDYSSAGSYAAANKHYEKLLKSHEGSRIINISKSGEPVYNLVWIATNVPVVYKPLGGNTYTTKASTYGGKGDTFHGKPMAGGGIFDTNVVTTTAANAWIPFGTAILVTYEGKNLTVIVRDRGPFEFDEDGVAYRPLMYHTERGLDLSRAAMKYLGGEQAGVIDVTIQILGKAE